MIFVQPYFWATEITRARAAHASSILITPPALEPLTLTEGKLRAGLDWVGGDPRDALMSGFIAAARSKVEHDTGLALLTQTRDVYLDALPARGAPLTLPPQSMPLQSITSVKTITAAGVQTTLDPADYITDLATGRLGLALGAAWPFDLRPFQPIVIRLISGWTTPALLLANAPLLVHAVGLLTAHYATIGRDLATAGTIITTTPQGYDEAIAPYVPVSLA